MANAFCKNPDCLDHIPDRDLPYIKIETDGCICYKCMTDEQKMAQCDILLNIQQHVEDIQQENYNVSAY